VREAPGETIPRGDLKQELDALPILDVCAVEARFEHQTLRIHQQMPLASFDLLGAIVAALLPTHARCLDRLAIHHAGARLGISVHAHPQTLA